MAKITVNGEVQEVQSGISLTELIKQNNVEQPEMVSVQLNDDFVDRNEWDSLEIKEGDTVDFLYFMGGGQELDDWTITPLDN
jgi:sulfur carrier protein